MRAVQVLLVFLLLAGCLQLVLEAREQGRPELIDYWVPMAACVWSFVSVSFLVANQIMQDRKAW
ncbi:MAG: hypothetical protein Q8R08_04195, partial [bacterium]|nr:hypothetical protein [bacterium]